MASSSIGCFKAFVQFVQCPNKVMLWQNFVLLLLSPILNTVELHYSRKMVDANLSTILDFSTILDSTIMEFDCILTYFMLLLFLPFH